MTSLPRKMQRQQLVEEELECFFERKLLVAERISETL